jgi:hypothetical protein
VYVAGVRDATLERSYGEVFNEVAVEYERNRPTYPDALVDRACEVAHIGERRGDRAGRHRGARADFAARRVGSVLAH